MSVYDTNRGLPWQNSTDVILHPNEYQQISTFNRCFRRLLENDKWLNRFALIVSSDRVEQGITTIGDGKYLKVEDAITEEIYYLPLYRKI
jgi:hypothetical protein